MNFRVPYTIGYYWLAEELLASQEGVLSLELAGWLILLFVSLNQNRFWVHMSEGRDNGLSNSPQFSNLDVRRTQHKQTPWREFPTIKLGSLRGSFSQTKHFIKTRPVILLLPYYTGVICVLPEKNLVMDYEGGFRSGSHLYAVLTTDDHNILIRIQIDSTITSLKWQDL